MLLLFTLHVFFYDRLFIFGRGGYLPRKGRVAT
jgi:hypothetical protein